VRLVLAIVILAGALACAQEARAACVAAVVVDGWVLYGTTADVRRPPLEGPVTAVSPACNDAGQNERDGTTTVMRLEGVPANVAVVGNGTAYVVGGSLTAMDSHPIHTPNTHPPRRRCGRLRTFTGIVDGAGGESISLLAEGRTRRILVDARTRLTNRPAYQPLHDGQRIEVTTRRCRNRVYADRIALTGPTVTPESYRQVLNRTEDSFPWGWLVAGVLALVVAVLGVERITRPR
jgi:hypothetical protein